MINDTGEFKNFNNLPGDGTDAVLLAPFFFEPAST